MAAASWALPKASLSSRRSERFANANAGDDSQTQNMGRRGREPRSRIKREPETREDRSQEDGKHMRCGTGIQIASVRKKLCGITWRIRHGMCMGAKRVEVVGRVITLALRKRPHPCGQAVEAVGRVSRAPAIEERDKNGSPSTRAVFANVVLVAGRSEVRCAGDAVCRRDEPR